MPSTSFKGAWCFCKWPASPSVCISCSWDWAEVRIDVVLLLLLAQPGVTPDHAAHYSEKDTAPWAAFHAPGFSLVASRQLLLLSTLAALSSRFYWDWWGKVQYQNTYFQAILLTIVAGILSSLTIIQKQKLEVQLACVKTVIYYIGLQLDELSLIWQTIFIFLTQ